MALIAAVVAEKPALQGPVALLPAWVTAGLVDALPGVEDGFESGFQVQPGLEVALEPEL